MFTDNDAGTALYNVTAAKPGDTVTKCVKTSYTGTLRFQATLRSTTPDTAQASSTGVHSFVWEAQSN